MTSELVRAARYLRMSTDNQRYSLHDQALAIERYAAERGYEIVRTYADEGKSGLTLRSRLGLQALLADALSAERPFAAVLVLDVSRWGRFQDLDQSAHYEFLCRQAGVEVVYCAEPFENDGSSGAAIIKELKRLMAAEYSRELSTKVTRTLLRHARLGLHCGGPEPYGFRRQLIDAAGRAKAILAPGSRRSFQGERVVLVHGPRKELATIRRIFRLFVEQRVGPVGIARLLNREGVPAGRAEDWSSDLVRSILTNERMAGYLVFNRSTRALKTPRKMNPPETWVRVRVLTPIVPRKLFDAAQALWGKRDVQLLDRSGMLAALRKLLRERGRLSTHIINDCPDTPCAASYARTFGGLYGAYAAIGYQQQARWGPLRGGPPVDNEMILAMMKRAYERLGSLSVAQINADASLPSDQYIRRRFGSLDAAFHLAGLGRGGPQRKRSFRALPAEAGEAARDERKRSPFSNDELLKALRSLHERDGYVSGRTLRREPEGPGIGVFRARFGTLSNAYELAGLPTQPFDRMRFAALERRSRFAKI